MISIGDITEQVILGRFEKLPNQLKEAASSDAHTETVERICRNYHLVDPEKVLIVKQLVGFVLLGIIHTEDLAREINERLQLANHKLAASIAQVVSAKIFSPIKEELEKNYRPLTVKPTTPDVTPPSKPTKKLPPPSELIVASPSQTRETLTSQKPIAPQTTSPAVPKPTPQKQAPPQVTSPVPFKGALLPREPSVQKPTPLPTPPTLREGEKKEEPLKPPPVIFRTTPEVEPFGAGIDVLRRKPEHKLDEVRLPRLPKIPRATIDLGVSARTAPPPPPPKETPKVVHYTQFTVPTQKPNIQAGAEKKKEGEKSPAPPLSIPRPPQLSPQGMEKMAGALSSEGHAPRAPSLSPLGRDQVMKSIEKREERPRMLPAAFTKKFTSSLPPTIPHHKTPQAPYITKMAVPTPKRAHPQQPAVTLPLTPKAPLPQRKKGGFFSRLFRRHPKTQTRSGERGAPPTAPAALSLETKKRRAYHVPPPHTPPPTPPVPTPGDTTVIDLSTLTVVKPEARSPESEKNSAR